MNGEDHKWQPEDVLHAHYPQVGVHDVDLRPLRLLGRITPHGIEVEKTCRQRERRSTLAHELVHLERGIAPYHPHYTLREERIVDEIAARRLIPLDDLFNAMIWCQGRVDDEVAEELGVDLDTLNTRINTLEPCEQQWLERQINRFR